MICFLCVRKQRTYQNILNSGWFTILVDVSPKKEKLKFIFRYGKIFLSLYTKRTSIKPCVRDFLTRNSLWKWFSDLLIHLCPSSPRLLQLLSRVGTYFLTMYSRVKFNLFRFNIADVIFGHFSDDVNNNMFNLVLSIITPHRLQIVRPRRYGLLIGKCWKF